MLRTVHWTSLLGLLALAATPVLAEPTLEEEHALRRDVVTPHTVWLDELPGGPLRVLFFSDTRNGRAREIIELMQRFPIEADAVYYARIVDTTTEAWHGGEAGIERCRRLLDEPYDVYLFHGVPVTNLPAELQVKLLERVTRGAGLVLVGVEDERVLKRPLAPGPGDPEAALFRVVEGRGARLPDPPVSTYTFGWEVGYDHWQERLGRTVLWAAGRLPATPLVIELAAPTFARGALPASVGRVSDGAGSRCRLRREDGLVLEEWTLADASADGSVPVALAHDVLAGTYHLDVWNDSRWATTSFTVTSPRRPELELDQDWGEIGQRVSGRVRLTGQALAGESVIVQLRDRRGRILRQSEPRTPDGEAVAFGFEIEPWFPMLLQVRAVVLDSRGEANDASDYFRVTKRHRGQFNFLVWDVPTGPTAPLAEAQLSRLGMTLQLSGGEPPRQVGAYDVAWVPYTTRIMAPIDADGHITPVPWNREPAIDEYVDEIVERHHPARAHGVFAYSLGDETVTRGYDISPSDLAAYRAWLEDGYGTIGALNASWETSFGQFADIELLDPSDPTEGGARLTGQYARWYDRQAWASASFIALCRRFGDAFARLDPEAITGFEGAGRFDRGDDFDGIVRTNGFWSPYPGPGDHIIRSLAPRDFPRANWMGYVKDADPLLWKYWRMILNGTDSVWWWRWDGIGRFNGLLMPTLSMFPQVAEMVADTRIVRQGLGDLLLEYEMQDDGIAILYSLPSVYASQLEGGPSYGAYSKAHEAWHRMLSDSGLNFAYVTDAGLRRDGLDPGRTRVLILSRAEALGDHEARVIRRFVEAGGTLIADLRPGLYDDHCKPRGAGAIDDLFGVASGSLAAAGKHDAWLSLDRIDSGQDGSRQAGVKLEQAAIGAGVETRGAEARGRAGDTPVMLVHEAGRGRAILLNCAVDALPSQMDRPEGRAFVADLLRVAGVEPAVGVDLEPHGPYRITRWRRGEVEILGIQTEGAKSQFMGMEQSEGSGAAACRLTLPTAVHAYDIRTGEDLGETTTVDLALPWGRAQFLALLPAAAPQLRADIRGAARLGRNPVLRLALERAPGPMAAYVTLTKPDGSQADWVQPVVTVAPGDHADVALPLALNDPVGEWTVRTRELFSGRVTELALTVTE